MPSFEDVDQLFRNLHRLAYKEYEDTVQQQREQYQRWLEENQEREAEERELVLRVSQLSSSQLAQREEQLEAVRRDYLGQVRSQLMQRPSQQVLNTKKLAFLGGLQGPNLKSIPVYATSIMSADQKDVAHIPGERGNPWVLPWNPGEIKISQQFQDTANFGLCGWARAAHFPVVADVWFAFIPETTAMWNLVSVIAFSGFYLLNAIRGFLLCRDSRITVEVSLNAYQYFWFGEKKVALLNVESDSGFKSGFYDELQFFDYKAFLKADPESYAFLKVRVTLFADAYGTGAWSEINFKDGAANLINPLVLFASPVG